MTDPHATSLDEIRALLGRLPGPDHEAAAAAARREARLTKPAGALGRLEELAAWLAAWQGRHPPRVERPRICVFAGNHGVAARGVSAYPAEVTQQMVANFVAGGGAVNQIAAMIDADLKVFELALETPTGDITEGPAMSGDACAHAMAYGMMAVEEGLDVVCLGEMGIGNTTAAAALCHGLFGGTAADWTGPGSGVAGERLAAKEAAVAAAAARHRDAGDPFDLLACLGGRELAALAGAILAARLARVPVVLDGYASTAAAAVLFAADRRSVEHCVVGHLSAEPAHRRLVETLGMRPLLDLGMRLGESSGAALAVPLLRAAAQCHAGMATFEEAGISGPG